MISRNFLDARFLIVFSGSISLFSLIFLADLIIIFGVPFYLIMILMGGGLLFFLRKENFLFISFQDFIILIFMFWLLVSASLAYNIFSSITQYYYYLISFLIFFLLRRFCFNKKNWIVMSNALLLGGGVSSILMLSNWNIILQGDRVNIGNINANYIAYSLVTLLPILYIFLIKNKIYYLLLIFFGIAIFLTGSRGALISFLLFITILSFKKPAFGLVIGLIIISCFTMLIGFYDSLPSYWKNRLDFQGSSDSDIDWSSGREATWSAALRLFEDHYIFGIGLNNFGEVSGLQINVHNVFLSLLVETGIFGFLFYFIAFFSILFYLFKRSFILGLIVLLIEIPIFFTGVWESSPVLWSVLSLLMAYAVLFEDEFPKYNRV